MCKYAKYTNNEIYMQIYKYANTHIYKYAEMALNTQIYKYTTTQIFNYAYKAKDEKSIHSGPRVETSSSQSC